MYIYLDETGNLIKGDSTYFIVATFTVDDSKRLENAFRRWQKTKLPKRLKHQAEVKFNDPHLTDDLRLKTIRYLCKQDIRIFYTYLHTKNIPKEYRRKDRVHESGLLYAEIVRATIELYLPVHETKMMIVRDRRTLKGMSPETFHEKLKVNLSPKLPSKTLFRVEAVDSTISAQVQVADWICGGLGRFYEKKPLGEVFYSILKDRIVGEQELYADYWTKK